MASTTMEEAVRPELTASERALWCEEIERRCGIYFADTRIYALRSALLQGMLRCGIETYREYHRMVSRSAAEWNALLEAILNRETGFFRHPPSFSALSLELLPQLAVRSRRGGEVLALWSAGCSSGEEAYSMAMAADEVLRPKFRRFEVLGSDLSGDALAAARRGCYAARAAADVPETQRSRYFAKAGGEYTVVAGIKAAVRFERFNFIDAATYPAAPQDVIFCQNVLIYFRESVRMKVTAALAACLRPGGYLVPGPGELAGVPVPGLECHHLGQAMVLRRK